jgi:hypothetical protein
LFFFLIKRTKNQVSKEASLRSWPLPGKTDKTTGCIILPPSLQPNAHGKKTLCPSRPQAQLVLSVFTRSFFADGFGQHQHFLSVNNQKEAQRPVRARGRESGL